MENKNYPRYEEIPLEQLYTFKNHPFTVRHDDDFEMLVKSIQEIGVIHVLLVRPRKEGGYEVVSGHRRMEALKAINAATAPCEVREMDDDHAIITMVSTNITHRAKLLPSEKARALKMRYEAARRIRLSSKEKDSRETRVTETIGIQESISARQVSRYIKLNDLNKQLLDALDAGDLGMDAAIELSYLTTEQQCWVYDYFKERKQMPKGAQAKKLRKAFAEGKSQADIPDIILFAKKREGAPVQTAAIKPEIPVLDYPRISQYYPPDTSVETMNDDICRHLEASRRHRNYGY